MQQPYTFIFVGRSGSGKGTQLELLKKSVGGENFSLVMGELFRAFSQKNGYAQDCVRQILNAGELAPDVLTISLFVTKLLNEFNPSQHLFVDGVVRTNLQAEALITMLAFYKRENPIIIDIDVPAEEVTRRMIGRGRADDSEAAIRGRLEFYDATVAPAIEHLKSESGYRYLKIDGTLSPEAIHKDLATQLNLS